jgi:hypothetical protein
VLRNPLGAPTWRAAWYLLSYLLIGGALFAAALTAVVGAAGLIITIAGIPLLIAAASVIRGCANVERARLRVMFPERVTGGYREPPRPGIVAKARSRWQDPATWREFGYLVGMFLPLLIMGCVVFSVWLTLLAGVTLPLWYWAPVEHYSHGLTVHGVQLGYFPNGPSGRGAAGLYLDTLPKALLAAVVCLILLALFSYVLVAAARAHATVARGLLRAPQDPLAEAKEVLDRSGPLTPHLIQNER